MQTDKTIEFYLQELSSASPTPGGGNVAAFCGALSSSLGAMVCNLTIGKKKYAAVEEKMVNIKSMMMKSQERFIDLANWDNMAFEAVMNAFKLPKETEEEKKIRSSVIDNATLNAAKTPAQVISACHSLLPSLALIADIGNQNSLSDAAVGVSLCRTAAEGAFMNVLINCKALKGSKEAEHLLNDTEALYEDLIDKSNEIIREIINNLKET